MKQAIWRSLMIAFIFSAGLGISSCKNKKKDTNITTTESTDAAKAPVEISTDDALAKGVQDATKDHPGVTATVNNGEITLRGTIERDKLTGLMQTLQGLNPKKINNELIVKE